MEKVSSIIFLHFFLHSLHPFLKLKTFFVAFKKLRFIILKKSLKLEKIEEKY